MPYKRKGSPYWWVSIKTKDGQRIRQSTGTSDKKEAEAIEGRLKSEAWNQTTWNKSPDYFFEDVFLEYLTAREYKSIVSMKSAVKNLSLYFCGMKMKDITKEKVKRAMHHMKSTKKNRPSTIVYNFAVFKAAIEYCRKDLDWELENVLSKVRFETAGKRVRWITKEESKSLINSANQLLCKDNLVSFIIIALNTGMRKSEILKLRWKSINFANRIIVLNHNENKSGKTRSVPINNNSLNALKYRLEFVKRHCPNTEWVMCKANGERWQRPDKSFNKASANAGIEDFRIHDMRHTCASWLVSAGVPLADVRDVLGHSSIKMTERYAHLAPHRAMNAVSILDDAQFGHTSSTPSREYTEKSRLFSMLSAS